jgi:hypothetical protein
MMRWSPKATPYQTCYIDKRKYDSIGQTRIEPPLATAKLHVNTFLLDGLRVQLYSRLCPWLLTWSDYEEEHEDDGEEFDGAGAN